MVELLHGKLAPITYTIGFLECSREKAVDAFIAWQSPIQSKRNVNFVRSELNGSLENILLRLLPLNSVERRRFLFVSTSTEWTAFVDNGHQSTDAVAPMSYLAEAIGCTALRATYIPDKPLAGRYSARILEIYGQRQTHFLNYVRSISLGYDGQKWSFTTSGAPQPFEDSKRYAAQKISDRFTPEMLDSYLRAMGLRVFSEDFYVPSSATLIEKVGPIASASKEYDLSGKCLTPSA